METRENQQKNYLLKDSDGKVIGFGTLSQLKRKLKSLFGSIPKNLLPGKIPEAGFVMLSEDEAPSKDAINSDLKKYALAAPQAPGVYKFINKEGVVIYVGKAKNLKKRLLQYFGQDDRPQIPYLRDEAVKIDYVVVSNELESLFLENTLIKQYLPKYNLKLKDDKSYAFIKVDFSTQIPTITFSREVDKRSKAKYFGPFSSVRKIKTTLDITRRIFPYCSNSEIGKRPCFYYHLHRCPGVCIGEVSLEGYRDYLDKILIFLSGHTNEAKKELTLEMKQASKARKYETAARVRDQLHALKILEERQSTVFQKKVSWDIFSEYHEQNLSCINLFKIREGKLIDNDHFILQLPPTNKTSAEILGSFMEKYYTDATDLPKEIYTQEAITEQALLTSLIYSRSKRKTPIKVPSQGKKLDLIKLGVSNAHTALIKWQSESAEYSGILQDALTELQKLLKLSTFPHRIEGYDISNTQGTNPVSSMVVTVDGKPAKNEYRKFKIKVKATPDDFAMMRETLIRRLQHLDNQNPEIKNWDRPDLIVIDGGKGQLSTAVEIIPFDIYKIPLIGLAKRIEEIFLPNNPTPIILPHDHPSLQLLQRLRDEAHRFGITFHRSLRSKQAVKSALDEIPGIGPKNKKLLKQKFGTVANIRKATLAELTEVLGAIKAKQLKENLS